MNLTFRGARPLGYDPPPMGVWADRLLGRLESQDTWPASDDRRVWEQVRTWQAFHGNDRNVLRENARWRNQQREYLIDPLAPKISEAFASIIFGQRPTVTAADENDQPQLDRVVTENNLARRLQRQAKRVSAEAESWWRVVVDPGLYSSPIVQFHSRLDVIPMFSSNDRLRAVSFIDELYHLPDDGRHVVWRHFEIIDDEHIANVLFCGTANTIGERVGLAEHDETADLANQVAHELPTMPAGRIINKESTDIFYGESDYAGIEDFLYELNEILTIFRENVRLTLKKRAVVPASAVDEAGTIDASQEILVNQELDHELKPGGTGGGANQFQVLEYRSDIQDVITAQNGVAIAALTRIGITPSFVGMQGDQGEGRSVTGTALRLKLIPTVNAGEDRAQFWDDEIPRFMQLLQIMDARAAEAGEGTWGGFGNAWVKPDAPPGIDRGSSLPQDEIEESEVHAVRVSAGIESRKTAITALHPDWSEEQVLQEISDINDDISSKAPVGLEMDTGRSPTPAIRGTTT